jgi:hypothetical protein
MRVGGIAVVFHTSGDIARRLSACLTQRPCRLSSIAILGSLAGMLLRHAVHRYAAAAAGAAVGWQSK